MTLYNQARDALLIETFVQYKHIGDFHVDASPLMDIFILIILNFKNLGHVRLDNSVIQPSIEKSVQFTLFCGNSYAI